MSGSIVGTWWYLSEVWTSISLIHNDAKHFPINFLDIFFSEVHVCTFCSLQIRLYFSVDLQEFFIFRMKLSDVKQKHIWDDLCVGIVSDPAQFLKREISDVTLEQSVCLCRKEIVYFILKSLSVADRKEMFGQENDNPSSVYRFCLNGLPFGQLDLYIEALCVWDKQQDLLGTG